MRIFQASFLMLSVVPGAASLCRASDITYDVDLTIGTASVTGDIATDGVIGAVGINDLVDFDLQLDDARSVRARHSRL
jgi:hypothetical protein